MGEEGQSAACAPASPARAWPGQEKTYLMSRTWAPSALRAWSPDPQMIKSTSPGESPASSLRSQQAFHQANEEHFSSKDRVVALGLAIPQAIWHGAWLT